ncbi:MAG: transposase [Roseibium sp.]|nr:transposase [Roseibium sp.]
MIYWNMAHVAEAVAERQNARFPVSPGLQAHASPLDWAHILFTGE